MFKWWCKKKVIPNPIKVVVKDFDLYDFNREILRNGLLRFPDYVPTGHLTEMVFYYHNDKLVKVVLDTWKTRFGWGGNVYVLDTIKQDSWEMYSDFTSRRKLLESDE